MKKLFCLIASLFTLGASASVELNQIHQRAMNNEVMIIDVREENEIKDGMVKGAKWFPLSKISEDKNWLTDFKKLVQNKDIYLYCRSGARSGKVKDILEKNGVKSTNIGGFLDLQNKLPTMKS